jgi:hypothetical protein
MIIRALVAATGLVLASTAFIPSAQAVVCAKGVYRAGCAGPNGAVAVRRPVATPVTTCRWVNGVRVCKRYW